MTFKIYDLLKLKYCSNLIKFHFDKIYVTAYIHTEQRLLENLLYKQKKNTGTQTKSLKFYFLRNYTKNKKK